MSREQEAQARPAVSITTVLFNSTETLDRFADPLDELLRSGFAELIAVDNASPDDSAERLKERLPSVRILSAPRNLGFAAGCNLAWPQVKGRYWMLLNPDVQSDPQGIRDLVRWMDMHPEVAVVSPMLNDEGGGRASVARAFPTIRWTLAEMLRLHKLASPRTRSQRLAGHYWNGEPGEVDWLPFAAATIRREAIEDQGLLSGRLFMYGEDLELCWRLRRAGWQVAVSEDATFVHTEGVSAAATWNEHQRSRPLVAGIAGALRLIHGSAWTRIYAASTALALYVENIGRGRESAQRRARRLIAREWLRQAVARVPASDETSANLRPPGAQ
jgi:GT2 family glycosyltransferase